MSRERHAHLEGGVASEVLVRQEQDALAAIPRPPQRRGRVRRRADHAALLADERFDRRGGVDVGHRHHVVDAHLTEFRPARFELVDRGHVGHRAAGGEVGQDDLLVRRREDVGALRHEVNAAEHDELGLGMGRAVLRQAI